MVDVLDGKQSLKIPLMQKPKKLQKDTDFNDTRYLKKIIIKQKTFIKNTYLKT